MAKAKGRPGPAFVPGQLIVKFKSAAITSTINTVYRQRGHKLIRRDRFLKHHLLQVKNVKRAMQWYKNHPLVEYVHPNYYCYTSATPNDPLYPTEYGLRQINTPDAWNVTIGSNRVIIAVVDTGIQYNHPDLSTKLLGGYNFVSNNTNWNDDNGHGTHVAGIAGAVTNNSIGIAGTSPLCRLLPVKTHNSQGTATIDNAARGIVYASNRGAHIINMSWSTPAYVEVLEQACAYAWNRGSVLVAAAGNSSTNVYNYPAAFATVIAVAATTSADTKASFSNYGRWVNVAAPGVDIMSTYPTSTYRMLSGTSMSAPFVSGTAALLASQGRTKLQIVSALQLTADKISGTGVYWIYGRINANRAVRSAFTISRARRSRVRVSVRLPYVAKKALQSKVVARSLQGTRIRIRYRRTRKVRVSQR